MTDKLPPQLLALFQPRPNVRYIPPQDDSPEDKGTKQSTLGGIAEFLPQLEKYKEEDVYHPTESWLQRKLRVKAEKLARQQEMASEDFDEFNPESDPKIKGDAIKTLFVGRLSYDVREGDLEREFSKYGPIERIRIVKDEAAAAKQDPDQKSKKKAHRGYAFIVYERERDMKAAYKETDGIRIKDRKIVVDVERGRMVKGWKPRRFGGGLGGRGYTRSAPARPQFGGPPPGPGFQGGFRGRGGFGDRGGFRGGFNDRGGGGFRGRGGFGGDRGGFGGDRGGFGGRGGIGYQDRVGFSNGAPPAGAPSGPGSRSGFGSGSPNGGGGYEDRGRNGYSGDRRGGGGGGGGGGSYDPRDPRGISGSNRDPVGDSRGGYGDRDRYAERPRRDEDYGSRKRYHEGDQHDDPRSKRRY